MISFFRKYLGNIYIPVLWSVVIGILLTLPGSVLPNEGSFKIPHFDKLVHMGMFGGFVFSWNMYLSTKPMPLKRLLRLFFVVFMISFVYGIGSEYVQKYFIPQRDFDEADIIADMIGASLAYGFSNITLLKNIS
ncbi:MAG TPA: VanZ family protein [Puia sp.]|nr:VanZ family protein [Puia sp.]